MEVWILNLLYICNIYVFTGVYDPNENINFVQKQKKNGTVQHREVKDYTY